MQLTTRISTCLMLGLLTLGSAPARDAPASPLEAFGALAVGEWEAPDSRHVMEWGVGRKIIHSKSYFKAGGDWVLVSEGVWYTDPSDDVVRGVSVAVEMPVELFEYRSEVRGETILHRLVAHGAMGGEFLETWEFNADGYDWKLEQESDRERKSVMGGAYRRGE